MKTRLKTRALLRVASIGLLLGTAWLAQAAITIIKADGSICTEGTINVDGTVTPVEASCSAPPPTGSFTLSVSTTGSGTVTSSPTGINCGADCSQAYTDSTLVTLTASPADGSTFGSWSGGGCTGSTAPTCAVNMIASQTVTAAFNPITPPPGGCGTPPPGVTVVDTGSLSTNWKQQMFMPLPAQITAFKVTVPIGFSKSGSFTATKTSSASKSKLVVVSTCPGVLDAVGGQAACTRYSLESSLVRLSANPAASDSYCKLTPGNTYYVNAVSKTKLTDTGYTCSNTTNCSFYANRSSPYN